MRIRQFGEVGRVLPDGSRLVKELVLDDGQLLAMAEDSLLLAKITTHRNVARTINVGGRSLLVVLGLVLAFAVIVNSISLVVAAVLALVLLLTPDQLARVDGKLAARREEMLAGLSLPVIFSHDAASQLGSLPAHERLRRYGAFLGGHDLVLGGVSVRIIREEDGASRLLVVTP